MPLSWSLPRAASSLFLLTGAAIGCSAADGPAFISGSAILPACNEPSTLSLDGSTWFDSGTVTITSSGCDDVEPGHVLQSCPLSWAITQTGSDVTIIVDNEYRVDGRLCGETLHLSGGWWLPIMDEDGFCTYDDDSAEEVGIEAVGSSLIVSETEMAGTISVRGSCAADYRVTFSRSF